LSAEEEVMNTFPPYRAQVVAEIPITTRQEREQALQQAGYNGFNLRANMVTIDLLTDSGTGAVSVEQEAAAARGDRAYAGSESFFRFREAVSELTSYPHILPVHQGRAAERILFSTLLKPGQISISNTHFDTTRANVELIGCEARDLPCTEADDLDSLDPFKGNINLAALENMLAGADGHRVGMVLITITNNGGGGQPVSMANLAAAASICRRHGIPLFLDAARFAENAWLVTQRESGYAQYTPKEVAQQAFQLVDGCVASLKKDGISPMGAFIGLRDAELAQRCEANLIATEGFRTYGGLAAHDLERLAQGLHEILNPHYLRARADEAAYLVKLVNNAGVDVVQPPGIHAIYLNAGRLLQHIPPHRFPGHALACELYLAGGIRCVELGSLYLGELDSNHDLVTAAPFELVRVALPRRVYTQSHLEYVAEVLASIAKNPERVPGYRIEEAPPVLRHFNLRMAPVPNEGSLAG
jgi:tryptophanase